MSDGQTALAVALEYEKPGTPRITAIGRGELARRIIELAQANDVPVTHKPELAHALSCLKIDEEIPVELYRAVAEVLIYILRIAEKARS
jgi:flagellar biosynthesis protein